MTDRKPNEQLQRIIEIDMEEAEKGWMQSDQVHNRMCQYIHHHGEDDFIKPYLERYYAVRKRERGVVDGND